MQIAPIEIATRVMNSPAFQMRSYCDRYGVREENVLLHLKKRPDLSKLFEQYCPDEYTELMMAYEDRAYERREEFYHDEYGEW